MAIMSVINLYSSTHAVIYIAQSDGFIWYPFHSKTINMPFALTPYDLSLPQISLIISCHSHPDPSTVFVLAQKSEILLFALVYWAQQIVSWCTWGQRPWLSVILLRWEKLNTFPRAVMIKILQISPSACLSVSHTHTNTFRHSLISVLHFLSLCMFHTRECWTEKWLLYLEKSENFFWVLLDASVKLKDSSGCRRALPYHLKRFKCEGSEIKRMVMLTAQPFCESRGQIKPYKQLMSSRLSEAEWKSTGMRIHQEDRRWRNRRYTRETL